MATYLDEWLETVAKPSVRPSTFYSYRLYAQDHLIPALGNKRLTRLTPTNVRAFVQTKTMAGLVPATVKQMHAILRAALQHAMPEDLVARNVAKLVVVPGGNQGEVVPLSVEELCCWLRKERGCTRCGRLRQIYSRPQGYARLGSTTSATHVPRCCSLKGYHLVSSWRPLVTPLSPSR